MIQSLSLINFRKFSDLKLNFQNKLIIFVGPNAVGKTSVLEAIYLISTSKSHRTLEIDNLICNETDYSIIEIVSEKKLRLFLNKTGKKGFINDVFYPKISDFIGQIPVILFSPTDIDLIQGSKSVRRRFLDLEISLLDKSYLRLIMTYKKLLKERNELLKQYSQKQELMLQVLTNQLMELIEKIYKKRIEFLQHLNSQLKIVCQKLNMEEIELIYNASYDIQQLNKSFQSKLNYDILSKTTNIGVHRDDFTIFMNQKSAKNFSSEGQGRNAILAIKFALMELYKNTGKDVILLLDDVFASIDQKRINHILEYIKQEHQTFVTTTSLFNIPDELLKNAQIIKL